MVSLRKILILILFVSNTVYSYDLAPDFKVLADRWTESSIGVVGQSYDSNQQRMINSIQSDAGSKWASMNKGEGRNYLWADLPFDYGDGKNTLGVNIRSSILRLYTMSRAFRLPGQYQNDQTLLNDTISALDYLVEEHYRVGAQEYGNWWEWEIGIPKTLNDIVALIYPYLTPEQQETYMSASRYFSPYPDRNGAGPGAGASSNPNEREATGGNRTDMVQIVIVRGILSENEGEINESLTALPQVLDIVENGDGFYQDNSFVQHDDIPYTGTYGNVLLEGVGKVMNLMSGSRWPANDPKLLRVYDVMSNAFVPFLYMGQMLDMQSGRAIARGDRQNHVEGHGVLTSMVRFLDGATQEQRNELGGVIKKQILEDTSRDFFYNQSDFAVYNKAQGLVSDDSIPSASDLNGSWLYPDMDRFVFHGKGFAFGIALHSFRTGNFECMNDENKKGWFTGDGATYLYNGDLLQYTDFWPIINPYFISGTTADLSLTLDNCINSNKVATRVGVNKNNNMKWVGGVKSESESAVGSEFYNHDDTLTALKSWFIFNNKIVALGSDIKSSNTDSIATTIDNKKLNETGGNIISINGTQLGNLPEIDMDITSVETIFIEGNVQNASVGYFLPNKPIVSIDKKHVTSNWNDIGTLNKSVSGYTFSMIIPHDINGGAYQYVIIPGISQSELSDYATAPDFSIIKQDKSGHVIDVGNGSKYLANIWGDGPVSIDEMTVSVPSSIIYSRDGNVLTISISDPVRSQLSIYFEMQNNGWTVSTDVDGRVSPAQNNGFNVNLEGLRGGTYSFLLKKV